MAEYRELLIGAGRSRERRIVTPLNTSREWKNLTTLDSEPACDPDIVWNLERVPWPFDDDTFIEVHAYEVLEHLGQQGDVETFFRDFFELWRVLRTGGFLCATVPSRFSDWLWGDPGHRRCINAQSLEFLRQPAYAQCEGRVPSPMSDYRSVWCGDFNIVKTHDNRTTHSFILEAVKPARKRQ